MVGPTFKTVKSEFGAKYEQVPEDLGENVQDVMDEKGQVFDWSNQIDTTKCKKGSVCPW